MKIAEGWISRYVDEILVIWSGSRVAEREPWTRKAIDILRQCGADGWVEKYERDLAKLQ